jgi:hypothetical protein
MGWTTGVLGFECRRGLGIFLFATASRTALGPTQPPIQWIPGTLSLGVKRQGREADHSLPSSAEVKNAWSYTFTPQYVFMAWCLVKHRDNFTFTTPWRRIGEWRYSAMHSWPWHYNEVCSASRPGRFSSGTPVPIGLEAGLAPEPVWTRHREKFPAPTGNRTPEPRSSSPQPIAIPTELPRPLLQTNTYL